MMKTPEKTQVDRDASTNIPKDYEYYKQIHDQGVAKAWNNDKDYIAIKTNKKTWKIYKFNPYLEIERNTKLALTEINKKSAKKRKEWNKEKKLNEKRKYSNLRHYEMNEELIKSMPKKYLIENLIMMVNKLKEKNEPVKELTQIEKNIALEERVGLKEYLRIKKLNNKQYREQRKKYNEIKKIKASQPWRKYQ